MKLIKIVVMMVFCAVPAFGWTCPKNEILQQTAPGTPGAVIVEGVSFICVPATSTNSNQTINTNQNTNHVVVNTQGGSATSSSNQTQKQQQQQSQSISNSGNSSASANGNGVGNGNNSDNSTFTQVRQVATAIAPPQYPSAPCFKTAPSGAVQGPAFGFSFGGAGRIDQNCAALEASRQAPSLLARCKVYISIKIVKAAGVTLDDCLASEPVAQAIPEPAPVTQPTVVVPAPTLTINLAPIVQAPPAPTPQAAPAAVAPAPAKAAPTKTIKRQPKPCPKVEAAPTNKPGTQQP